MGAIGLWVADAVHDSHLSVVPKVLDGAHAWAQPQFAIQLNHVDLFLVYSWAVVVVKFVFVWDDRVQIVVAPSELDNHKGSTVIIGDHVAPLEIGVASITRMSSIVHYCS